MQGMTATFGWPSSFRAFFTQAIEVWPWTHPA